MHLHLDCQFGVAGDMFLAALVDAGADLEEVLGVLRSIPLEGFELECRRATRGGIAAMLADVKDLTHGHEHEHEHGHGHEHKHNHDHHGHDHHNHDHGTNGPHRHLSDLLSLLEGGGMAPRVRERAERVFRIVAAAEATVHGVAVDKVHFHEISGIDTAVDVIGTCVALELLGVDSISASPPSVGSGMVMCEHGVFPVPAPATLEILKSHNVPWRSGGEGERVTPTGAALLAGLADAFGDAPEMTVTRIGYGAGHREFADGPNLLRAIVGKPGRTTGARERGKTVITGVEREPGGEMVRVSGKKTLLPASISAMLPDGATADGDRVVEFRFVVDDMTPEALAFLCERCLGAGALEAYATPAMMKKGRAGHEVTVLSSPEFAAVVVETLWTASTTFGMRVGERSRLILPRETREVAVLGHRVRVKFGWLEGRVIRRQPEYEDCRAVALAEGLPLEEVFLMARAAAAETGDA